MALFLAGGDFFSVFSVVPPVHCWGPCFPNIPHFAFIALTVDRAGELLDLGETLLAASAAPTANANLGKFMTAALGTGASASTRHFIACRMGPIYPSFVGGAMNYNELRVGTREWGSEIGEEDV
jgi:hypothetical protein